MKEANESIFLSVIIPVYNEEDTVLEILRRVGLTPVRKEIIVVDDYSSDMTRDKLRGLSDDIKVVLHDKNMGKGAAIRTGLQHATGDAVIIQDADLEYDPNEYMRLLAHLTESTPVVYGSRFLGSSENMTPMHLLGNKLLTTLTNLLFSVRITDMETCYKMMTREVYSRLDIQSERFNVEPEITAKVIRMGYSIIEVPISYKGRHFTEGKKISWKDGFSAVTALLRFRYFSHQSIQSLERVSSNVESR